MDDIEHGLKISLALDVKGGLQMTSLTGFEGLQITLESRVRAASTFIERMFAFGAAGARVASRPLRVRTLVRLGRAPALFQLDELSTDGCGRRPDGALVRWLDVRPTNPLALDVAGCDRMTRGFTELIARVPAGQSIQIYAQATPVPIADLIADARSEVDAATAHMPDERADALQQLAECHEESLEQAAEGCAAVEVRYVLVAPYLPPRRRGRATATPDDLRASQEHTDRLAAALGAVDMSSTLMDGDQVTQLLRSRIAPTAATDELIDDDLYDRTCAAPIELPDHRTITVNGEQEQVIHVSCCPERTFYGWLLHAMQSQVPWTLSVHISPRDRQQERERLNRRARRVWGINEGAAYRRARPDHTQQDQESELEQLVAELATGSETVADVAIYQTLRAPDRDTLDAAVKTAVRGLGAVVDAGVSRGEFLQKQLWQSSLPLGLDVAKRTVPMITRNAADSVPFLSTSCGSPDGIPFAIAEPGRTIERLNPFDRQHDNATTLLFAKSGGGKTMTTILLTSAAMTRGCQVNVLDRSAGHYKFLCDLIPGAVHLELGAEEAATVNPWDVEDPAAPPRSKVAFLVRLNALLIGDHDAAGDSYGLAPLERNLLAIAIRGAYDRAARLGSTPQERLLHQTLHELAENGADPENAAVYRNLAYRLSEVCNDGTYAYLFDRPTSVGAEDAPLIVFNTRQVPDDVAAPALFAILEFVSRRVERRYEAHVRRLAEGRPSAGPFDGTSSVVLEELWKLTERRATGTWVNELFRRARHIGLWPIAITQQCSDLAGEHGHALLDNATIQIYQRNGPEDIAHVARTGQLSPEEVDQIGSLTTEKGSHAQAYVVNGDRGRGQISIRPGARMYWIATSDPVADVPRRERAVAETTAGSYAASPGTALDALDALDALADHDRHPSAVRTAAR